MAYKVVRNKRTNKLTLEFFKVFQRNVIEREPHAAGRRVIKRNGRDYHVTKGWR